MSPFVVCLVALKALSRNRMRSMLTMLGIVIGVSAVICTVAIGDGAASKVSDAIASIGANMIWIEAGNRNVGGVRTGSYGSRSLLVGDAKAIQQQILLVTNVSPSVDTRVQLIHGNQNWSLSVRGVAPEYLAVKSWPIARGEMFNARDVDGAANVCVLGSTVVGQLFTDEDPIGETIRVNGEECRVSGVLAPKGQSVTGQDQDDTMMMPYTTVMKKLMGHWWLDDMMMSAVSAQAQPMAEDQIKALLRDRHRLRADQPDDFNIRHPTEIGQVVAESARTMEVLLASVASVSLFVGGVGIMNIMLVSVTERTREIGLRLAVGARARDVLRQFLIEALLLSIVGGALGVAVGLLASHFIASTLAWPTRVSPTAMALAFGVAGAIGLVFGYYPARRAAGLDPIEALRFE
ncbi:MAG TPA: ABC transporter permease [Gemmatimonadaceae bacterium]